jgi:hypothetical protein
MLDDEQIESISVTFHDNLTKIIKRIALITHLFKSQFNDIQSSTTFISKKNKNSVSNALSFNAYMKATPNDAYITTNKLNPNVAEDRNVLNIRLANLRKNYKTIIENLSLVYDTESINGYTLIYIDVNAEDYEILRIYIYELHELFVNKLLQLVNNSSFDKNSFLVLH